MASDRKQMAFTSSADLFSSWRAWCGERGIDAGEQKDFTKALQERGLTYKHRNKGGGFKDGALAPLRRRRGQATTTEHGRPANQPRITFTMLNLAIDYLSLLPPFSYPFSVLQTGSRQRSHGG
jgi:hypothetical protein